MVGVYELWKATFERDGVVVIRHRRLTSVVLFLSALLLTAVALWALLAPEPAVPVAVARVAGVALSVAAVAMWPGVARGVVRPMPVARLDRLGLTPGSWPRIQWTEVEGVAVRRTHGVHQVEVRVAPSWWARAERHLAPLTRFAMSVVGKNRVGLRNGSRGSPADLRRLIMWVRDRSLAAPPDGSGDAMDDNQRG